jgi:hypothetical protein
MKKLLTLITCIGCCLSNTTNAQSMEITRSDIGYPGASYSYRVDTSYQLPTNFLNVGSNLRWDFSNAANNESFSTLFLEPNASNGGDTIPDCNLVVQDDDNFEEYTYLTADAASIRIAGGELGEMTEEGFKPRIVSFPLKFGSMWSDSSNTTMTVPGDEAGFPVDSVRFSLRFILQSNCDAHGTLILPSDSVEVLRIWQKVEYNFTLSAFTMGIGWTELTSESDQENSYIFVNQNGGYNTATISEIEGGNGRLQYRDDALVSVKKVALNKNLLLFPNPVSSNLHINASNDGVLSIFDLQGKVLKSGVTIVAGANQIDASTLTNGQYLVVIRYADGTMATTRIAKN